MFETFFSNSKQKNPLRLFDRRNTQRVVRKLGYADLQKPEAAY